MWRRKKFIIVVLLATVVLVGSIGGVVLAQTGIIWMPLSPLSPSPYQGEGELVI